MTSQQEKLFKFGEQIGDIESRFRRDESRLGEVKSRLSFVAADYAQSALNRIPVRVTVIAVAAAAAFLVYVLLLLKPSVSATYNGHALTEGEWISSGDQAHSAIEFSDGAAVSLQAHSRVRVRQFHADGAQLLLEAGSIDVSVPPRENTRWNIDVGPYGIRVTGTRFSVSWDGDTEAITLKMIQGTVAVSGPMITGMKEVRAGERLTASTRSGRMEFVAGQAAPGTSNRKEENPVGSDTPSTDRGDGHSPNPVELSANAASPRTAHPRSTTSQWKIEAETGHFSKAVDLAKRAGIESLLNTESADALLLLGDAARHSGDTALAERTYLKVTTRFKRSQNAVNAAFAMGVIAFDTRHNYQNAVKWFSTITNKPGKPHPLRREAAGRLMEAYQRLGNTEASQKTAKMYISDYPTGPHRPLADRLSHTQHE